VDQPRPLAVPPADGRAEPVARPVGCVVSDFDALPERLTAAEKWLTGTKYTHKVEKNHADVTCPWGNRIRLHRAGSDFGFMTLGMPYVEFPVPTGHADGIARFYPRGHGRAVAPGAGQR